MTSSLQLEKNSADTSAISNRRILILFSPDLNVPVPYSENLGMLKKIRTVYDRAPQFFKYRGTVLQVKPSTFHTFSIEYSCFFLIWY